MNAVFMHTNLSVICRPIPIRICLVQFQEIVLAAADDPNLVGIAISTRPDCVNDAYLEFLAQLKQSRNLDIDIELGLQTVNYHNLVEINRGIHWQNILMLCCGLNAAD